MIFPGEVMMRLPRKSRRYVMRRIINEALFDKHERLLFAYHVKSTRRMRKLARAHPGS